MRCRVFCSLLLATLAGVVGSMALGVLSAEEPGQTGVAEGIDWNKERQFWSFRPPMAQARPTVKAKRWPTQETDPRTLIRRVTFDLTGLPPTPEEVQAFLKDKRPDAYSRLAQR